MDFSKRFVSVICQVGMLLVTLPALAQEGNYGPYPEYYSQECGRCHVPYPPQLMTLPGWEKQIKTLDHHFGINAAAEVPASQTILAFLVNNAAWQDKFTATDSAARLTQTTWFIKKHSAYAVNDKKMYECSGCHAQAAQGNFAPKSGD